MSNESLVESIINASKGLSNEELKFLVSQLQEQIVYEEEAPIADNRDNLQKAFYPITGTMVCVEEYPEVKPNGKPKKKKDKNGCVIGYDASGYNLFRCSKCNNSTYSKVGNMVNQNRSKCVCSTLSSEGIFSKYCSKNIQSFGYEILRQYSVKIDGVECSFDYVFMRHAPKKNLDINGDYIFVEILDANHKAKHKQLKDTRLINHVMDKYPNSRLLYINLQNLNYTNIEGNMKYLNRLITEMFNGNLTMNLFFDVSNDYEHLLELEDKILYEDRVKMLVARGAVLKK